MPPLKITKLRGTTSAFKIGQEVAENGLTYRIVDVEDDGEPGVWGTVTLTIEAISPPPA